MLKLPERGMTRSVNVDNVKFDVLCDWIEAELVFGTGEISKSSFVDTLMENEVYAEQDMANASVDSAWAVLSGRLKAVGRPLGAKVTPLSAARAREWTAFPAYAYCMLLACAGYLYPKTFKEIDLGVAVQGDLFERLSAESVARALPKWTVVRLGWSPTNPQKLKDTIAELTASLKEMPGAEIDVHVTQYANEMGLDLLAYREFSDPHAAFPVLMLQCASGKDWTTKRHTPDLNRWRKVVSFLSNPVKGFAMPYAFADQNDFRREATSVDGVLFDRYRLLAPVASADWASHALRDDLTEFVTSNLTHLPHAA